METHTEDFPQFLLSSLHAPTNITNNISNCKIKSETLACRIHQTALELELQSAKDALATEMLGQPLGSQTCFPSAQYLVRCYCSFITKHGPKMNWTGKTDLVCRDIFCNYIQGSQQQKNAYDCTSNGFRFCKNILWWWTNDPKYIKPNVAEICALGSKSLTELISISRNPKPFTVAAHSISVNMLY